MPSSVLSWASFVLLAVAKSWLLQLLLHLFMADRLDVEAEMCRLGDGVCLGDGELRYDEGAGEGTGDADVELWPPSLCRELVEAVGK